MSTRATGGVLVAVCTAHGVRDDDGRVGCTGIDKRPRTGPVTVAADVLDGDLICDELHHGGRDQAVYAYAREEAQRWATELGREVPPGWFGENLTVDGLAVTDAVIGERWRIGGDRLGAAVLEVTLPRIPCMTFSRWVQEPHWVKRFTERGDVGAYLRVVRPGIIAAGDVVEVEDSPEHGVTVRQLFTGADPSALARLLELGQDLPAKAVAAAEQVLARAGRGTPTRPRTGETSAIPLPDHHPTDRMSR